MLSEVLSVLPLWLANIKRTTGIIVSYMERRRQRKVHILCI